ncbi:MAG: metallophosphoesterase [Verrucomicrobiia bacterium]
MKNASSEDRTWFIRHLGHLLSAAAVAAMLVAGSTAAADEPAWRFVVVGDSPGDPAGASGVSPYLATVAQAIANENPKVDFVLFPGDLISDIKVTGLSPSLSQQYTNWLAAMAPIYDAGIPVYPVRGNHEAFTATFGLPGNDKQPFLDAFAKFDYIPNNGPANAKRLTYSFQYKNCLVLGLDLYINGAPDASGEIFPEVDQSWVDQQLATNQQPHVFVFGHTPLVQVSINSVIAMSNTMSLADAFFDSLVNAGCKTYFCGHDHFYNRSFLERNGKRLCQMVSGNGGATLAVWNPGSYSSSATNCDISAQLAFHSQSQFGYCVVTVSNNTSLSSVMKFLDTPTNSTVTAFDAFDFNYFRCATAGMSSSLTNPAASSSRTTAQGTYTDPVKGGQKKTKLETLKSSSPPVTFPYQWSNKIVLSNQRQWDATKTAEENLQAHPMTPLDCDMVVTVGSTPGAPETIAYLPPIITTTMNVVSNQLQDLPLSPGETIILNGFYFGTTPPRAWLEYSKNGKIAKLMLKAAKNRDYPDAHGHPGKSCMDLTTGQSSIQLTVPKAWPKGWNAQENHNIVIDNGVGIATMNFAEQPTSTPPE